VTITDQTKRNLDISQINKVGLSPAEIKALPRFAGEVDVIKALQLMPGVRAGKEGSGDFHVRGGGPDQNLILLDGVPIYNSAHSLGLFSVFNADAIKSVELSKGGFPSRYGGRLSSVMDIRLKDGNNDHFRYDFSLGLISSRLLLEGPFKNENTTFMIGVRRTYLDLLASIAQGGSENKGNYNFYDLNAKISHRFNEKDRLYFSIYSGNDRLGTKYKSNDKLNLDRNSISWGNITSALRYNHLFNSKLFSNLTVTYTNYNFGINNNYSDKEQNSNYELNYSSKIDDAGFKTDFDYIPNNNHFIRFGSNAVSHNFRPNVTSLKVIDNGNSLADTAFNNNNIKAMEYFLYAEDEIKLSNRLQANAGLHFSGFYVQQKNYFSLQPRLSLNYILNESSAIRASYAQMNQYIHLLTTTGSGSPADI
ncbi:MAG: TonB-dependent receptor, partial [Daejeonella sp.]